MILVSVLLLSVMWVVIYWRNERCDEIVVLEQIGVSLISLYLTSRSLALLWHTTLQVTSARASVCSLCARWICWKAYQWNKLKNLVVLSRFIAQTLSVHRASGAAWDWRHMTDIVTPQKTITWSDLQSPELCALMTCMQSCLSQPKQLAKCPRANLRVNKSTQISCVSLWAELSWESQCKDAEVESRALLAAFLSCRTHSSFWWATSHPCVLKSCPLFAFQSSLYFYCCYSAGNRRL